MGLKILKVDVISSLKKIIKAVNLEVIKYFFKNFLIKNILIKTFSYRILNKILLLHHIMINYKDNNDRLARVFVIYG